VHVCGSGAVAFPITDSGAVAFPITGASDSVGAGGGGLAARLSGASPKFSPNNEVTNNKMNGTQLT
jgi:hypothetical protein